MMYLLFQLWLAYVIVSLILGVFNLLFGGNHEDY